MNLKGGQALPECVDVVYWVQKFTIRNCSALVACFEFVVFSSIAVVLFCVHYGQCYYPLHCSRFILRPLWSVFFIPLHHCSFCVILANNRQCIFFHVRSFVVVSTFCCCCLPGEKDDAAAPHTVRLFSASLLSILIINLLQKKKTTTASSQYYATMMAVAANASLSYSPQRAHVTVHSTQPRVKRISVTDNVLG